MKRSFSQTNDNNNEPEKKFKHDWAKWVSATETFGYIMNDPIIDWLKYHNQNFIVKNTQYIDPVSKALGSKSDDNNNENFPKFVMKKGTLFEQKIDELLKAKFDQNDYVDIGGTYMNVRSEVKFDQTKKAILDGIPVIFSGVLWDKDSQTYGVPDLIIRSDYLDNIFEFSPVPFEEKFIKAKNLKDSYHYYIVDVKFKTLHLRSDGKHLLNEGLVKCYKSQLYIYNRALSKITGYDPKKAFLLGRGWSFTKKYEEHKGESCFSKLGEINYRGVDKDIPNLTDKAVEWIKDVRINGKNWSPFDKNPRSELYPNMSNTYDFPWTEVKRKIANELKEITMLWMCSVKNRKEAHKNGIYSWNDENCTPKKLGINGEKTKKVIGKMIEVNKGNEELIPKIIKNNMGNWQDQYILEFYVDFETINDVVLRGFDTLPISKKENYIFQIGVWCVYKDKKKYKTFIVDDFTKQEEEKICKNFYEYIQKKTKKANFDGSPPIFHWNSTEASIWDNILKKYGKDWDLDEHWIDMLRVVKEEPVVIKGVFDFGLKSFTNALYNKGLINISWGNSKITNGANVMLAAKKSFENSKKNNIPWREEETMREIIKYNEIDCRAVYEIVQYLRKNHVK